MKKRKRGRKLNRKCDQRKALLRGLVNSLILTEKIKISDPRAKEITSITEKFITKAKKNDLATIRLLSRYFSPKLVKKLISEIGPRYKERKGGYTRIIKIGPRKSDGSRMSIIELIK